MNTTGHAADGRATAPPPSLVVSCAILIGVMLAVLGGFGLWASSVYGSAGWLAGVVGWALCAAAALISLILSAAFARSSHSLAVNLGTMLLRMGAPLVGLVVLPQLLPSLAEAGLGYAILIHYLAALVCETLLAVRHVASGQALAMARSISSGKPLEA